MHPIAKKIRRDYDLRLDDFDYNLPPELIASHPVKERDGSRLLLLNRDGEGFRCDVFRHLPNLLRPNSVVVVNDTQVIPARLEARKPTGGKVELLLVRPDPVVGEAPQEATTTGNGPPTNGPARRRFREVWEVMGRNLGSRAEGTILEVAEGLKATVLLSGPHGSYKVAFEGYHHDSLLDAANSLGRLPLPPYIEAVRRKQLEQAGVPISRDTTTAEDVERYQTVYASHPGAVAAPTAGLHFTPAILRELEARGHQIVKLTLHVGPGTFRPVQEEDPTRHQMDVEHYNIPHSTWAAINQARAEGRPIVAVGTTVVRALEGAARAGWSAGPGSTQIFIKPGDAFAIVTDLITNFHLPRSTLLMLVAAFAGHQKVMEAYRAAVDANFRFYSYGDAMFISPWPHAEPEAQ